MHTVIIVIITKFHIHFNATVTIIIIIIVISTSSKMSTKNPFFQTGEFHHFAGQQGANRLCPSNTLVDKYSLIRSFNFNYGKCLADDDESCCGTDKHIKRMKISVVHNTIIFTLLLATSLCQYGEDWGGPLLGLFGEFVLFLLRLMCRRWCVRDVTVFLRRYDPIPKKNN